MALWDVVVYVVASSLDPNLQAKAGVDYRPFANGLGFEVAWTSRGMVGCVLQVVLMRPFRILNSYIFACGADGIGWLRCL